MAIQYTLKELFLATTLIAVGIGGLKFAFEYAHEFFSFVTIVSLSGTALGAGVFTPFQRKRLGAILGTIVAWIIIGVVLSQVSC